MSDERSDDEGVSYTPKRPPSKRRSASKDPDETPSKRSKEGLTADDLLKIITALQQAPSKNISTTNVVPEFDPNNKSQDVERWIRKVNECSIIYGWDDKQTIHYALQKLCGLAKSWYESLPSLNYSWEVWQSKLKKAFPNDVNFGKLLDEMLSRKSRTDETLRDYFYDKLSLTSRCEIVGRKAVDCIIYGITDSSIRNGAQALKCEEPKDLLNYLASQQPSQSKESIFSRGSGSNTNYQKKREFRNNNNSQNKNSNRSSDSICFNCHESGHIYQDCTKPLVKCVKCHRIGHNTEKCGRKPLQMREVDGKNNSSSTSDKKVLKVVSQTTDYDRQIGRDKLIASGKGSGSDTFNSENTNVNVTQHGIDKFTKHICLNGVMLSAYIDFGSDCSLIRVSDARQIHLTEKKGENLPVIRGFGNAAVFPKFKSTVQVRIDEVETELDVLAVDDSYMQTPVLIGQNFTELSSVTVLKDNASLFFYHTPSIGSNSTDQVINLFVANDTTVTKGGLVEVYSKNPYTGDIYFDGGTRMNPNQEYHLHQGCYRVDNGKAVIFVTALTNTTLSFKANTLLARARPLAEAKTLLVQMDQDKRQLKPLNRSEIKISESVNSEAREKLYELLLKYRDCFAANLGELGCAKDAVMDIELHDKTPVIYRPYRLSHQERQKVRDIVEELIDNDIVQESDSNYASPILLVRKKNGESRLCVDYRALNNKTIKDKYPLPLIDDQLSNLSGNKFFVTLDLASGYYQIPMGEESRHLTAFVTPDGHFEFKRMPFGLANAPAVFQKMINRLLGARRFKSALAYMDDLLIPSSTIEEGFERLEDVLKLLREAGLTLKLSKCSFFDTSIEYLGYEISSEGIKPSERKISAVRDFPMPKNVHEVRQFLGLASYFRRFVRGFGEIARPLTVLLKKDSQWRWTGTETKSFETLKSSLIERPLLALYNPDLDTEVHTDASSLGLGGILMQWQTNPRVLKPVAYFSRQTTPEERHFHSYELETLAVVCSLKKFRPYLLGLDFTVYTDCNALRTTLTKRDLIPRIARWWLLISEFNFNIEYRPGCRMGHVDALSRNPPAITDGINMSSTVSVLSINTDNWILTLQMADPELQRVFKILKPQLDQEALDIKANYIIKNHSLHRKIGDDLRLVVPKDARWQICKANHDDVGHFGITKTLELIQSRYWFPKLRRFVQKYVAACIDCAYNKDSAARNRSGHLHPIEKIERPFHTLHLDHLGPFVKSKTGNSYILTIVDGFTKYLFARPVKDTKSKTVLKILEHLFTDFGVPSRIITDRGTAFTSSLFKTFCVNKAIKHVLNAVACPRANGQAERFNQTILRALSTQNFSNDERDWDQQLGKVQWGINNTVNATTKKSASELLFGVKLNCPIDNMLNTENMNESDTDTSATTADAVGKAAPTDSVSSLVDSCDRIADVPMSSTDTSSSKELPSQSQLSSLQTPHDRDLVGNPLNTTAESPSEIDRIRKEASANIKLSQERLKESYDSNRSPAISYTVGDLVKITKVNFKNDGKSKKLMPKFIGPYKVTRSLGNDRYEISNIPGFTNTKYKTIVAADRMRRWINVKALDVNKSSGSESSSSESDNSCDPE